MVRAARVVAIVAVLALLLRKTHLVADGYDGPGAWVRWGLLLALSFCGWGSALDRFVVRWSPRPSMPLRAAWGLSLVVFLIGLGAMAHVAKKNVLFGIVALGWIGLVAHVALLPAPKPTLKYATRWLQVRVREMVVYCAVGFAGVYRMIVATELHPSGFQWDDAPAYFVFIKQLFQTGHFDQPFSVRRLVSYGGQTALQALLLCDGSDATLHMGLFDEGLCALLAALLIVASETKLRSRALPLRVLAAAVLFLAAAPKVNSAAVMSGVLLLLATWATLVGVDKQRPGSWRALVPVALVASAACTLRQNYVPVVALTVIGWFVARIAGGGRARAPSARRLAAMEMVSVGLMVTAFLLPWFEMAVRSFHNPLFPLLQGSYNKAAAGFEGPKLTAVDHLYTLAHNAVSTTPALHTAFMLLALGLLMLPRGPARTASMAFLVAAVTTLVLQVWKLGLIDLFGNARYSFAYEIGALSAIAATAAIAVAPRRDRPGTGSLIGAVSMIVAGAALQVYQSRDDIVEVYVKGLYPFTTKGAEEAEKTPPTSRPVPHPDPIRDDAYRALQSATPAGDTILAWLDDPYLLDFRRNPILIGDFPAAVSPAPGLPILSGEDAVTSYLLGLEIHYVAFVLPTESHGNYKRAEWVRHVATTDSAYVGHKAMAPYWMALFDYVEAIAKHHKVIHRAGGMVLVDLSQPAGDE